MNRRAFLAGLTATASGLLVPERKVWALDQTMMQPLRVIRCGPVIGDYPITATGHGWMFPSVETMEVDEGVVGYTKVWARLDQRNQWMTSEPPYFVVSGDYLYGYQGENVYRWDGAQWEMA